MTNKPEDLSAIRRDDRDIEKARRGWPVDLPDDDPLARLKAARDEALEGLEDDDQV